MFFVLSTGRAGSRTAALAFSQSPNCECLHEPRPQLIAESLQYRTGDIEAADLVEVLRRSRPSPTDSTAVYGEANNRLSFLVPVLNTAFPTTQFLHLVRDGRDVVSSTVQRGWYGAADADPQTEWRRWRPDGAALGAMPEAEWQALSPFARNCWLWTYLNRLIQRDLGNLDADRTALVRLEDFADRIGDVADRLGLQQTAWVIGRVNRRVLETDPSAADEKSINRVDRVLNWEDWPGEDRATFERWCGELMDEHYPEWRHDGEWRRRTPADASPADQPAEGLAVGLLQAIRTDVSELKVIRGEMSAVLRLQDRTVRDSAARVEEEAQRARSTRGRLERERKAWSEQVAAHQRETQGLQDQLGVARREADTLRGRLESTRKRERQLRSSTSFRLGHTLVRSVKAPIDAASRRELRRSVKTRLGRVQALRALTGRPPLTSKDGAPSRSKAEAALRAATRRGGSSLTLDAREIVLVLLLGMDRGDIGRWSDYLAEQEVLTGAFRAVVVMDTDDFSGPRRHRMLFEYLPTPDDWRQSSDPAAWPQFVERRLQALIAMYQPSTTLWVQGPPPAHQEDVVPLAALLQSRERVIGG